MKSIFTLYINRWEEIRFDFRLSDGNYELKLKNLQNELKLLIYCIIVTTVKSLKKFICY